MEGRLISDAGAACRPDGDVNLVMGKVEEDGFEVSGFWARRALKASFRGLRDDNGQPILPVACSMKM